MAVALGCAIFVYYVVRRMVLGRFWGALIVGLIGAVLGGLADQLFDGLFKRLANLNTVNLFSATTVSMMCIWLLSRAGHPK